MKTDRYIKATLAWCNKIRVSWGEEPLSELPKGFRYDADSCPCGRATGYTVGRFNALGNGETIDVPKLVGEFVARFDAGGYPDLIEKY